MDHVGAVRAHREDVLEIVEHDASAEVGDVDRLPDGDRRVTAPFDGPASAQSTRRRGACAGETVDAASGRVDAGAATDAADGVLIDVADDESS